MPKEARDYLFDEPLPPAFLPAYRDHAVGQKHQDYPPAEVGQAGKKESESEDCFPGP